ncbi:hypothetical protein [Janthinobacterium fluminis]|uniref:Secreted protein n=1 Tax=Janthinobacterium fluminis TaxID=2987524 RepID=A0ABT5K7I2_9BURK|nr:hypothetical protein [Janthinobacterium fluminis]MDC8760966.1 hypothetical protein [Janthinobacterium fluminis]
MRTKRQGAAARLLCCAASALASAAPAAAAEVWMPVAEAVLDGARGGVDLGGGLLMSLGIDRLATVNGAVVASSSVHIADLSRLGGAEAALTLLQNGSGNTFVPGAARQAAATVIQNTLNNQVLRTQTVINASVNSLELLKMINFQESLHSALSNVAGAR